MLASNQEPNRIEIDLYKLIGEMSVQIKGQELVIQQLNKKIEELMKPKAEEEKK